mmetsp:Transcript_15410/g.50399  ORF Transcript_15410/g.50399 Transcript_15410/m.50399 type:complete len:334 (-) Transcript_15410:1859-2860(-)
MDSAAAEASSSLLVSNKSKKKRSRDDEERPANEKTGRWTDDEHTRFLHGLELFGKKWTKVADIVGSRTTVQVRSHAQKYFQKIEKSTENKPETMKKPSSSAENHKPPAASLAKRGSANERKEHSSHAIPTAVRAFLPRKVLQRGRASAGELAAGIFKFLTPLADVEEVPEWYRKAGTLVELLDDAATVDWTHDNGGPPLQDDLSDDAAQEGGSPPPSTAAPTSEEEKGVQRQQQQQRKKKVKRPSLKKTQSAPLPPAPDLDLSREKKKTHQGGDLPRYNSLDALLTVAVVDGRRQRALSQESYTFDDTDVCDSGLFYDNDDTLFLEPGIPPLA